MLFSDSFFTIIKPAQVLHKDRGSKFYGFAFPVKNESDIKQNLVSLKKEHPSATHHCYAWRLGPDKLAYRVNDDGEPSNSAGKPILGQIESNDLTNILVVVVRYFGGTLLGVNGLINAYRSAAAEAIKLAGISEQFIQYEYEVQFGMEDMSPVMRILKELEVKIISNTYDENNRIVFHIKKQHTDALTEKMTQLYRAKLKFINLIQ
jgi:uncharacterized YigZ family protein